MSQRRYDPADEQWVYSDSPDLDIKSIFSEESIQFAKKELIRKQWQVLIVFILACFSWIAYGYVFIFSVWGNPTYIKIGSVGLWFFLFAGPVLATLWTWVSYSELKHYRNFVKREIEFSEQLRKLL